MAASAKIPVPDDWPRQATALRALAAALWADEHEAEDLLQETWLRAARNPERAKRRTWLATVLKNLVRDRTRRKNLARWSERSAAREEALPSDTEIVERLEVAERVAREVSRLPELYRRAVHLRYFEGLSPEEIARREGLPRETVRTRLRRGLALLRERLDLACEGGRSTWMSALAPIALRSPPVAVTPGSWLAAIGDVMMGTKILIGVAAAATVALVVYLDWPEGERAKAPGKPVISPRASAPSQVARPQPPPRLDPQADQGRVVVAPATRPEAKAPEPVDVPIAVRGTIVVDDEHGVEHPAEDGSFSLVMWAGDTGTAREIAVMGGRWRATLASESPVEALGVTDVRLGERPAVWGGGEDERLPVPVDGWLELRVRWPAASLLSVRDSESGRELDPVFLTEVDGWPESDRGHPGTAAAEARDLGPSPVVIQPSPSGLDGLRTLFARSPGHAWGRIEIDEQRGGERILLLERAGELEVVVVGAETDPSARLCLYRRAAHDSGFKDEIDPAFESDIVEPLRLIEAIPAGSYRVQVKSGNYWDEPLVLGEAQAEVVAGQRSSVSVTLRTLAPRVDVPLAGTLVLPAEWALASFELDFELLDAPLGGRDRRFSIDRSTMTSEGDPPTTYRWSTRGVQPGRYEVNLQEPGFTVLLAVGSRGLEDARIEVPPPCEILVRCIEEDTTLEVADEEVSWHCTVPEGVPGSSRGDAVWDETMRHWRIRAPQGATIVGAGGDTTYCLTSHTIEAGAGTSRVLLRLSRTTGLRLILRDGSTELPWTDGMDAALDPAEGQQDYSSRQRGTGTLMLLKKEPGRYELRVSDIPGYESVPAQNVLLEKGVVKEHVIELRRKP